MSAGGSSVDDIPGADSPETSEALSMDSEALLRSEASDPTEVVGRSSSAAAVP